MTLAGLSVGNVATSQEPTASKTSVPSSRKVIVPGPEVLTVSDVPLSTLLTWATRSPVISTIVTLPELSKKVVVTSLSTIGSICTVSSHTTPAGNVAG